MNVAVSGNEELCVHVGQEGWLGMGQWKQRLVWVLILPGRQVCMGLQGQSPGLDLGSPGGGGGCRPHLGLTGGCFSQQGKRQAGVQQQRAVGVWGKRKMEG